MVRIDPPMVVLLVALIEVFFFIGFPTVPNRFSQDKGLIDRD